MLLDLSCVKRAERRGTMRGAARMTAVAEKRRRERSRRKTACRIGGRAGASVKERRVHLLLDSRVNLEDRGVRNASLIAGKLADLGETSNESGQSVRRLAGHVVRGSSSRARQGRKRQEEAAEIKVGLWLVYPTITRVSGLVMSEFG